MIVAEHEGNSEEWECDEYPATPPEFGSWWEDHDGYLYYVYDYDHRDHAVYLIGVDNDTSKYKLITNPFNASATRHGGMEYCEELFHFEHLYKESNGTEENHRSFANSLTYRTFIDHMEHIELPEDEKQLMLLGKVP